MKAIQRVLAVGGKLYFSVPISYRNAIIFNSHRVFKPEYILRQFDQLKLNSFAYIHEYVIHEFQGKEAEEMIRKNQFHEYDCGMFIFTK